MSLLNVSFLLSSMKTQEKPWVICPQPRGLKSVIQIMGCWGEKKNCYLHVFPLCVSILLLTHLPPVPPESCQTRSLCANKTPCWLLKAYCGKEGPVNKIVRAGHQGWSVEGGHREERTARWSVSWFQAIKVSLPPLLSLQCIFSPLFLHSESLQALSLKWVMSCWDHLRCIYNRTLLRPLFKLYLKSGGWVRRPHLEPPKTSLLNSLILYKTATFQSGVDGLLPPPLFTIWIRRPVSDFTRDTPEV